LATTAGIAALPAVGTLSRTRILVAAAPTTSKQTKATRVIDFVTQISVSPAGTPHFAENWELIKALPCHGCGRPVIAALNKAEKRLQAAAIRKS
jgi:hypothetical protein